MTAPTSTKRARPLSPHIGIYKKQLTSGTSILHRVTGVALVFALPVLVTWLLALSRGLDYYNAVLSLLKTPIGQFLLAGWTFSLFYHLCNGIRHLVWDTGRLLTIEAAYKAGYIVIATSVALTALMWLVAYKVI